MLIEDLLGLDFDWFWILNMCTSVIYDYRVLRVQLENDIAVMRLAFDSSIFRWTFSN